MLRLRATTTTGEIISAAIDVAIIAVVYIATYLWNGWTNVVISLLLYPLILFLARAVARHWHHCLLSILLALVKWVDRKVAIEK